MATPDLPEEAVEAAASALWDWQWELGDGDFDQPTLPEHRDLAIDGAVSILAAAAPHIRADERARVLDEVQAALRDRDGYANWERNMARPPAYFVPWGDRESLATYLRDTLGAGGDVIIPAGTLKVGEVVHLEASGTIESEQVGYLVTGDRCDRCGDTNYDDERVCLTCTYPDDPCSRAYLEQP